MKTRGLFFYCALFLLISVNHGIAYAQTDDETTLTVRSDIAGAEVFINGALAGKTPLVVSPAKIGLWKIAVAMNGYYTEERTVRVEKGKETEVLIALRRITGMLKIKNLPPNAVVSIQGIPPRSGGEETLIQLPEGPHTVLIRAFGYADVQTDVKITREKETLLKAEMQPAAFEATGFKASKKSFNPGNPGNLGIAAFSFSVSAPGSAALTLESPGGERFELARWGEFGGWDQEAVWDGLNPRTGSLEEGVWTAILSASDGSESRTQIEVDSAVSYPASGFSAGMSAAGPVASGTALPAESKTMQFELSAPAGRIQPGATAALGWRVGSPWTLETGAQAVLNPGEPGEGPSIRAAFSVKGGRPVLKDLRGAFYLRHMMGFGGSGDDGTDGGHAGEIFLRNGLAAGCAADWSKGLFALTADLSGTKGDARGNPMESPFTLSFGAAAAVRIKLFSAAFWLRGETGNLENGASAFTGDGTASFGLTNRLLLPGTNLAINGTIGRMIGATRIDSISASFGFLF